jgi:hypothetical protein
MIGLAALMLGSAAIHGCTMDDGHAVAMHDQSHGRAEAGLRQALAGYAQGATTSCVNSRDLEGNRSFGANAILFEGTGDRFYLNRPGNCPVLGPGRTLQVRSVGTQLCRGDIADVVDLSSRTTLGGCSLGDFTAYTRAR